MTNALPILGRLASKHRGVTTSRIRLWNQNSSDPGDIQYLGAAGFGESRHPVDGPQLARNPVNLSYGQISGRSDSC